MDLVHMNRLADTQQSGLDADWGTQMACLPCNHLGHCGCAVCDPEGKV